MAENLPNLGSDTHLFIQKIYIEAEGTPNRTISNKSKPGHIVIKLLKT